MAFDPTKWIGIVTGILDIIKTIRGGEKPTIPPHLQAHFSVGGALEEVIALEPKLLALLKDLQALVASA